MLMTHVIIDFDSCLADPKVFGTKALLLLLLLLL